MIASIRLRVVGATSVRPLTTFETVGTETPASSAIRAIVTAPLRLPLACSVDALMGWSVHAALTAVGRGPSVIPDNDRRPTESFEIRETRRREARHDGTHKTLEGRGAARRPGPGAGGVRGRIRGAHRGSRRRPQPAGHPHLVAQRHRRPW